MRGASPFSFFRSMNPRVRGFSQIPLCSGARIWSISVCIYVRIQVLMICMLTCSCVTWSVCEYNRHALTSVVRPIKNLASLQIRISANHKLKSWSPGYRWPPCCSSRCARGRVGFLDLCQARGPAAEHIYFGESTNPEPEPGSLISAERWGGNMRGISTYVLYVHVWYVHTYAVRRVERLSISLVLSRWCGADWK